MLVTIRARGVVLSIHISLKFARVSCVSYLEYYNLEFSCLKFHWLCNLLFRISCVDFFSFRFFLFREFFWNFPVWKSFVFWKSNSWICIWKLPYLTFFLNVLLQILEIRQGKCQKLTNKLTKKSDLKKITKNDTIGFMKWFTFSFTE